MRYILIACLLMLASPLYASTYLCVEDQNNGYKHHDNGWKKQSFIADKKYILRPWKEGDPKWMEGEGAYLIQLHGAAGMPPSYCKIDGLGMNMNCGGPSNGFTMSMETLRFSDVNSVGWIAGLKDGTIGLAIGSCTEI